MSPSVVAKCMTKNDHAIDSSDYDHSEHISGHLTCRQDNCASCLNCKIDFRPEMPTAASFLPPLFLILLILPLPPVTFEMQAVGPVTQPVRPRPIHTTCTCLHSFHLSLPSPFCPSLSDQRQLCNTKRYPGSRKHQNQLWEQLSKRWTETDGPRHTFRVCVCLCVRGTNKWIN